MTLFGKSKAHKAQDARAEETRHDGVNDPHMAHRAPGATTDDYSHHGNHAPVHTNNVPQHSSGGYQDPVPGTGYAAGTGHHHHGHHGGPVDRAEQRVEHAVGARAVRNQVGDKEQEVNAIKAQSAELAEAERLEREAKMHRDRAVAGGAHPANQRLGAGWQS